MRDLETLLVGRRLIVEMRMFNGKDGARAGYDSKLESCVVTGIRNYLPVDPDVGREGALIQVYTTADAHKASLRDRGFWTIYARRIVGVEDVNNKNWGE